MHKIFVKKKVQWTFIASLPFWKISDGDGWDGDFRVGGYDDAATTEVHVDCQ